ncbi:MAG: hypothetical protein MZW92_61255 [Comamonadaceae bacterium]|nr:hypothetical protein [Comamonadaceae bacterium]
MSHEGFSESGRSREKLRAQEGRRRGLRQRRTGEIVGLLGPQRGRQDDDVLHDPRASSPRTAGRVFLKDEDVTDRPMYLRARKGLVLLPQEPSAFRKMTVAENLMAVLETRPSGGGVASGPGERRPRGIRAGRRWPGPWP